MILLGPWNVWVAQKRGMCTCSPPFKKCLGLKQLVLDGTLIPWQVLVDLRLPLHGPGWGLTAYVFKQATLKYLKIIDTLSSLVHDVFNITPCSLILNVFDCFRLGIGRLGGVYTMQEVGGFAG